MRKLSRFVVALVALALAFPGVASAAQVIARAVCTCCPECPLGCC